MEPLPEAASAEHLTEALRSAGALDHGRVSKVVVESSRATILSRIIRLRLTYEGENDGPASLILKIGLQDRADGNTGGRREVAFYSQVARATAANVLPRCFEAHWNEDTKAWHLLLEDLTDTHAIAAESPLPPPTEQLQAILRARARFHAAWWDDPRLGVSIGAWSDAAAIAQHHRHFTEQYALFSDRLGNRLPRERRDLYARFIDRAPGLTARYTSHRNMTIVHGDAHVWNCLLPRDGGDDVRLFDWDCWRPDTASDDLAYMMAMHWYPDYRRDMEGRLLDDYHAALVAHGVCGYSRDQLNEDYRLSALWQIATPVWQAAYSIPSFVWWHNLERCMMAVDDLGCRALLD